MQLAGTFLAYVIIIDFSHMLKLKLTNLTAEIGHRRLIFQLFSSDSGIFGGPIELTGPGVGQVKMEEMRDI